MVSKEFHASRRKLYRELLEDNSVGFVFPDRRRRTGEIRCFPLLLMQISIILRDLISRRLFYDIKDAGSLQGNLVYRSSG